MSAIVEKGNPPPKKKKEKSQLFTPKQCFSNLNSELPDVQAGFRKGRGIRLQIASIHWIIEKAREFKKNIYF